MEFAMENLSIQDEKNITKDILTRDRKARQTGDLSLIDFKDNNNFFLETYMCREHPQLMKFVKENNAIIAGGFINGLLDRRIKDTFPLPHTHRRYWGRHFENIPDIDIFFYEPATQESVINALYEFNEKIKDKSQFFQVSATPASFTFCFAKGDKMYKYQFIKSIYPDPRFVILSFDVPCCAFGIYYEDGVLKSISTESAKYAREKKINIFDPLRGSYNTFSRFNKYEKRGYSIDFVELDKTKNLENAVFNVSRNEIIRFDKKGNFKIEKCQSYYHITDQRYVVYDAIEEYKDIGTNDGKFSSQFVNIIKCINGDRNLIYCNVDVDFRLVVNSKPEIVNYEKFVSFGSNMKNLSRAKLNYLSKYKEEYVEAFLTGDRKSAREIMAKLYNEFYETFREFTKENEKWMYYKIGSMGSIFGCEPVTPENFYKEFLAV